MSERKVKLFNGGIFHVYTRSIAEFKVFTYNSDFMRMQDLLAFYRKQVPVSYSDFWELKPEIQRRIKEENVLRYVEIIAYCIMPTHIHLILYQVEENGISKFMEKVLKSYSLHFNKKIKRQGPLWAGKFSNILIESDEQLLHLTRYIHLNPVTAYLVEKPDDWLFSSYNEYTGKASVKICNWKEYIDIKPGYRIFVEERKDYQRELQKIKHLLFE